VGQIPVSTGGSDLVSAEAWLLSSPHRTRECSWDDIHKPKMSSRYWTNIRSRDSLKFPTMCGFRTLACQCRIAVQALTPNSAPILRVLRSVAASDSVGVVSSTSCRLTLVGARREASHARWLQVPIALGALASVTPARGPHPTAYQCH